MENVIHYQCLHIKFNKKDYLYQRIYDVKGQQREIFDVAGVVKMEYVIYVILEKLEPLLAHISATSKPQQFDDLTEELSFQKYVFNWLIQQLATSLNKIDEEMLCFLSLDLQNIYLTTTSQISSRKCVFSFQVSDARPVCDYAKPDVLAYIR
jgi:hypothetical protein